MGILAKQWLRDFIGNTAGSPRDIARIRQLRHAGLIKWHVPEIIAFLPVLLQFSLAFFFIGLLDLLWSLNSVVAAVITCFVSISLAFLVVTTILPTISRSSPHHSPQALAVYRVAQGTKRLAVYCLYKLWKPIRLQGPFYFEFGVVGGRRRSKFAAWLRKQRTSKVLRNWRELEKDFVRNHGPQLDHQLLSGADALFMDDRILAKVIRPCVQETDYSAAINCVTDIVHHRAHGNDHGEPSWAPQVDTIDPGMVTLLRMSTDVLERLNPQEEENTLKVLMFVERLCTATPFKLEHPEILALYRRVHEVLAILLAGHETVAHKAFSIMLHGHQNNSPEKGIEFDAKGSSSIVSSITLLNTPAVIERIITYAHQQKKKNDGAKFFDACTVALKLCTDSRLRDAEGYVEVQDQIRMLLTELKTYLTTPALTSGWSNPSPSLMMAVVGYLDRNREVREQLDGLIEALRPTIAPGLHAHASSSPTQTGENELSKQLLNLYRPKPHRKPHIDVEKLRLPTTPPIAHAGPSNGKTSR